MVHRVFRRATRAATTALLAFLPALPSRADPPDLSGAIPIPGTTSRIKPYATIQIMGQYYFNQYVYDNGTLFSEYADALNAHSTPDRQFTMTARTSFIGFSTAIPTAPLGDLYTNLELGFNGGKPSPIGKPKVRQAWIGFGRWTIGYTWSNWINWDAQPETVDASGPIGSTCFDTGFYTQVCYTVPLDRRNRLILSLEQNQRAFLKWGGADNPNLGDAATIKPDARYPTGVAAWEHKNEAWGQVSLRLLGQQYGAYQPANPPAGAVRPGGWACAAQVSGNFKVARRDKLAYSVYTGEGVGVYGFNPQAARFIMSENKVLFYRSTGWQAGYTHNWNERWRSNLIATGLYFGHTAAVQDADVRRVENYFVNTIVKLAPSLELGLEYGFEGLRTFGAGRVVERGGGKGDTNRSNKLQVALTAKF
ncbi:MAG: DcaP family trimeric outer membrane transporter [Holophaga sp.]|jgi:hypothetical protein